MINQEDINCEKSFRKGYDAGFKAGQNSITKDLYKRYNQETKAFFDNLLKPIKENNNDQ
jgi:flagellar biosynthesis/type III secretory pathway protein FliH